GDTGPGTVTNKAEARAARAWAYFEIRRVYRDIPLFTKKSTTVSDAFIAKSTVAQVDAFIETELKEAAAALPLTWPSDYLGRATKGFANALLAKLYLYQGKYADAYTKSTEVINSGQYSLLSDFKKVFSKEGNNSTESVFEIQFLCRDISDVDKYNSMYYGQQGFRGSGSWDLGWGFNAPTQNLIDFFANDPRKEATILVSGQNDGYGLTVPSVNDTSGLWNKKAYTDPADRKSIGVLYNRWYNIKVIRYADVLLMAAEAAIQTGNTASAANYINQIRNRVGLSSISAPSLSDLKTERRAELAMENERFYDLVRWGDASSVLGSLGYTAKNALYPIPQDAIDQSGGKLLQNPNY
ncbi:MAG: RagB/SusD family nutrient uptake outer membrane protein, partial [Crocinitomicaceae bacterium]|nr:RagB/SusD family nutrient uptake outer membrane protein [Crocinitomicaceae bacterium]